VVVWTGKDCREVIFRIITILETLKYYQDIMAWNAVDW